MRKGKRSGLMIFLGIYLFILGLICLCGGAQFITEKRNLEMAHTAGIETIQHIEEGRQSDEGRQAYEELSAEQREVFDSKYEEIKELVREFKENQIDKVSYFVVGLSVFNVIVGMFYIIAGINVFRCSIKARRFFKLAAAGVSIGYVSYILYGYKNLVFANTVYENVQDIMSLFDPEFQREALMSSLPSMYPWMIMIVVLTASVFILIPLFMFSRRSVKERLVVS